MHGIEEGLTEFITWCDYLGTFAFAISGIRLAAARRFDWFGAYVVGVVTAVGGGTVRDILLNVPPFWMLRRYLPFDQSGNLQYVASVLHRQGQTCRYGRSCG